MSVRALVTGATGYLGSHLAKHLIAEGHEVHALLRASSQDALAPAGAVLQRYDGTARDALRVVDSVRPNRVFHLAANQSTRPTPEDVDALVEANVLFGTQLAYACARVGVSAFVNTGTHWQKLDSHEFRPTTLYAATKQSLVDVLAYFADAESLPAITLELPATYGPGDPRGKVLDLLIDAVQSGETLDMSPGEQVMDLVHVDDVSAGFIQAARAIEGDPSLAGSTFALHGSEQPTLREIIDLVAGVSGSSPLVNLGALPYGVRELMRPTATPTLPGWSPRVDLATGIREVISARPGG